MTVPVSAADLAATVRKPIHGFFRVDSDIKEAEDALSELGRRAAERDAAVEALQQIEAMAGAAGSGETPAMPIAQIARAALAVPPSAAPDEETT